MHVIQLTTKRRCQFIDITAQIADIVKEQKIMFGICIVFCPHTTAGLTINENADPDVQRDIVQHLEEIIPEHKHYAHLEGNADAHIKGSLFGSSLTIIIEKGRLVLGTWQGVYFCECDGPRRREVYVKIIKG